MAFEEIEGGKDRLLEFRIAPEGLHIRDIAKAAIPQKPQEVARVEGLLADPLHQVSVQKARQGVLVAVQPQAKLPVEPLQIAVAERQEEHISSTWII